MNIIVGIAKGLKYLHTEIVPPFTISEFNSSAVYLTDDFSPKVCLRILFPVDTINFTVFVGSIGTSNFYFIFHHTFTA